MLKLSFLVSSHAQLKKFTSVNLQEGHTVYLANVDLNSGLNRCYLRFHFGNTRYLTLFGQNRIRNRKGLLWKWISINRKNRTEVRNRQRTASRELCFCFLSIHPSIPSVMEWLKELDWEGGGREREGSSSSSFEPWLSGFALKLEQFRRIRKCSKVGSYLVLLRVALKMIWFFKKKPC